MAKGKSGGDTEKKPPAPKQIAQVTLTIYDDGTIIGDFWIWEKNELDKRKKWTVTGEDFFRYLHRVQPNNVRAIAAAFNVQIVQANLDPELQGPWLRHNRTTGRPELYNPAESMDRTEAAGMALADNPSPMRSFPEQGQSVADRIADGEEADAAEALGLSAGDAAAALPHNQQAQEAAAAAGELPESPPALTSLSQPPSSPT